MSKKAIILGLAVIVLAVIALIIVGVGLFLNSDNSEDRGDGINNPSNTEIVDNQQTPALPSQPKAYSVDIKDYAYSPLTLTIKQGDEVTWTNQDAASHTVTSDSGNELDSELLSRGESYSHTFNERGTFDYYCKPHPYMKGKIIVE